MRRDLGLLLLLIAAPSWGQEFRIVDPALGAGSPNRKVPHDLPPFSHWDLREGPDCEIPWTFATNAVPDIDADGTANTAADRDIVLGALETAFGTWEAVESAAIGFRREAVMVGAGASIDSVNSVGYLALGAPGLQAFTVITADANTGRVEESDIVFNRSMASAPDYGRRIWVLKDHGDPLMGDQDNIPTGNWPAGEEDTDVNGNGIQEYEVDLGTIAIHEIGHFIGLHHIQPVGQHNDPDNALMEEFWIPNLGPDGGGFANTVLKDPDVDACNFLYTPDLGDAPDRWNGVFGEFPSLVHDPGMGRVLNGLTLDGVATGAEHLFGISRRQPTRNFTYEWLGGAPPMYHFLPATDDVDGECEAHQELTGRIATGDLFDDGVSFTPFPPAWNRPMIVRGYIRHANDAFGNGHDYPADSLYFNVWIDSDQNCVWDSTEHVISEVVAPGALMGANTTATTVVSDTTIVLAFFDGDLWVRARLDWGEDAGVVANHDETLDGPRGAAQFGEVEDYQLWCETNYYQYRTHVPAPGPKGGIRLKTAGNPSVVDYFGAEIDSVDCVQSLWDPDSILVSYDALDDARTVDFRGLLPACTYRHIGVCTLPGPAPPGSNPPGVPATSGLPQTVLQASWLPEVGEPGTADLLPTSHTGLMVSEDAAVVLVGVLNELAGGPIRPVPDQPGQWLDSLHVDVSYRISPEFLPLERLSTCDSLVQTLPEISVGGAWVTPDRPFAFEIPNLAAGESIILEIDNHWSVNGHLGSELVQYEAPITGATDAIAPSGLAGDLAVFPNPASTSARIHFAMYESAPVEVRVIDVVGRHVRTLVGGETRGRGEHFVDWDLTDAEGRRVPPGVYFYRLQAGERLETRKVVVLR